MINVISSIFAVLFVSISGQDTQEAAVSPCPTIFTYESPGAELGKWYGVVNLTTDTTLYALWLNIIVDSQADIVGNWVGEVTTKDNLDFQIENNQITIDPGSPLLVRFFVQYNDQKSPPRLKAIRFNGKEICNVSINEGLENETIVDRDLVQPIIRKHVTTSDKATTFSTISSKSFDTLQTTLKPRYWQQATVENNYQVKSEKKETTPKSQYWLPPKIEAKTTIRPQIWPQIKVVNNQKVNTESKSQNKINENSQSIIVDKVQLTDQISSKVKVESSLKAKAIEKAQYRTEIRPQSTTENKLQPSSKLESSQQTKARNAHIQQNNTKIDNSKPISEDTTKYPWAHYQIRNHDKNSLRPIQTEDVGSKTRQQTTTEVKELLGYTDRVLGVIPHKKQQKVVEDKQNWSDEWLSNSFGDTSPGDSKNNSSSRVKNIGDRSVGTAFEFRLTTDAYPTTTTAATRAPIMEDFYDNQKHEETVEYYIGGLPGIYIPKHGPRIIEPQCGQVMMNAIPANNLRGSATLEGQWPWQIALYQQQTTVDFKYICGGTLVSKRHVITAAHCVTRKGSRRIVNKNTLTVYLGKHNLRTSVDGVQVKFVDRILVPAEYNGVTFKGDLAILELKGVVAFSNWVQPACLWPESEDIDSIVGRRGAIVGWGFDMTGLPREELSLLQMYVVDQDTCLNSKVKLYSDFYQRFTSNHTYCAAYNEGYSACNGDSGGGMVFEMDDTWFLRGVASLSVARAGQYHCDPNQYVVFTDIAKFLTWIEDNIDDY